MGGAGVSPVAITEAASGNADELAAAVARAEAEPDDHEAQAPLAMIEAAHKPMCRACRLPTFRVSSHGGGRA